jgi:hypothetical protein
MSILIVLGLLFPVSAQATDIELTVGVKAGGGGELWTAPTDVSVMDPGDGTQFDIPLFNEARGGYNYSIGLFTEARVFGYFALELGMIMTRRTLVEDTTFTYTDPNAGRVSKTKSHEEVTWGTWRFPVMAKFLVPVRSSAIWVGVGIEYSKGMYASTVFDVTGDPLKGKRKDFTEFLAVERDDLYVTWGAGILVRASHNLHIPIEMRFGYNTRQPSSYFDRAEFDQLPNEGGNYPTRMTINARDSFYGEILIGVSYNLL